MQNLAVSAFSVPHLGQYIADSSSWVVPAALRPGADTLQTATTRCTWSLCREQDLIEVRIGAAIVLVCVHNQDIVAARFA